VKIAFILGTRPEIIKLSSVIFLCIEQQLDFFILHTNQHYSANMDQIFFNELHLPAPEINLNIGSGTHGYQTGKMIQKIEKVLLQRKPDVVLVQGDTNTVLAGSIATSKIDVKLGHVEAGLRSYDRNMPEEINRVLADHVADYCFAPTITEENILLSEAISKDKISVTGNTVVDAVLIFSKMVEASTVEKYGLNKMNYIFLTVHRPENVDNKKRFKSLLRGLEIISENEDLPVIFPIHPRTQKQLDKFNLSLPSKIKAIHPVSYLESLSLMKNARIIMTDSGGIQEEACILGIPCITLRENTERPQTVNIGSNILVGVDPAKLLEGYEEMVHKKPEWQNPFGDGKAAERIVDILKNRMMNS